MRFLATWNADRRHSPHREGERLTDQSYFRAVYFPDVSNQRERQWRYKQSIVSDDGEQLEPVVLAGQNLFVGRSRDGTIRTPVEVFSRSP